LGATKSNVQPATRNLFIYNYKSSICLIPNQTLGVFPLSFLTLDLTLSNLFFIIYLNYIMASLGYDDLPDEYVNDKKFLKSFQQQIDHTGVRYLIDNNSDYLNNSYNRLMDIFNNYKQDLNNPNFDTGLRQDAQTQMVIIEDIRSKLNNATYPPEVESRVESRSGGKRKTRRRSSKKKGRRTSKKRRSSKKKGRK